MPVVDFVGAKRAIDEACQAIDELVADPFINARNIDVNMVDAVPVHVRHGLGRHVSQCLVGPPVGATATGRIVRSAGDDSTEVVLTATGHGATISVTITVW